MNPLITPHEAEARIAANLPTLPAIDCPLEKCAGRVLRQVIRADRPFPPFNRAMMDGYAIRLADRQHGDTFTPVAQAPAGSPQQTLPTPPGSCIEIMTGAVVPTGADCVVRYEDTRRNAAGQIELLPNLQLEFGEAIHPRGSDHRAGAELLRPGRRIGSRESAIAATCGHTSLQVAKLPALTIVSTGDELVDVAAQPAPHQIRRSNDCAIETALARTQLHARRVTLPTTATSRPNNCGTDRFQRLHPTGGISKGAGTLSRRARCTGSANRHGVAQTRKPFHWSARCASSPARNPLSVLVSLHRYVPALFQSPAPSPPPGSRGNSTPRPRYIPG